MMTNDPALARAAAQIEAATPHQAVVRAFFDSATSTISYVVHDPVSREAAVVDPVIGYDPASGRTDSTPADAIATYVEAQRLSVAWLLETHVHADHLSGAPYLQEKLGGQIAIGEHIAAVQTSFGRLFRPGREFAADGSDFDRLFADGDRFRLGGLEATVLHVPGHTPACVAYVIADMVFVGDTMFMPDYGTARADFPGGDARQLFRSLRRILDLPGHTRLFMCHDYLPEGRDSYQWETTVEAERRDNIHAHDGVREDDFVAMREGRDAGLAVPRLLLPSIQVNMRAGRPPAPEENGIRYLRIPLNAFPN